MPKIAVTHIEYQEGGKALWIHSAKGVTVLRIQCTGQIKHLKRDTFIYPCADLNVTGDITICLPLDGGSKPKRKRK